MTEYPLVIRNRTAFFARGFMLFFLGGVALMSLIALRDGAPEPQRLWPWIMAAFWTSGLFGLIWSLNQEVGIVRITNPNSIHNERGKAFRREEHWTDRARLWIDDTRDSDGDPYFKLWMDAPGGRLCVSEGHQRKRLEELQQRVETAISGR